MPQAVDGFIPSEKGQELLFLEVVHSGYSFSGGRWQRQTSCISPDGTATAIQVGSNAWNLEHEIPGLKAEQVSTDLIVRWAPSGKRTASVPETEG